MSSQTSEIVPFKNHISNSYFKYVTASMLSMVLVGFYGIADGFFIGRYLGDEGLAAINLAWPLLVSVTSVGIGIGTGGSVLMSLQKGEGNVQKAVFIKNQTFALLIGVSVVSTAIFLLFVEDFVRILGASDSLFDHAVDYMHIISYGITFQILGAGLIPIIKNSGKPVSAMIVMVAGMSINIILDAYFLVHLHMGLEGIALATCIAQSVVAFLGVLILGFKFSFTKFKFDKTSVIEIFKIGLSPFGLSFAPCLVTVATNYQCLFYGGTYAVAAFTIMAYASYVVSSLLQGLSDGVQPIVSFCKGSKNISEMKKTIKKTYVFGLFLSLFLSVAVYLTKDFFPFVYGASPEVASYAGTSMICLALSVPFICVFWILSAYFYGIGDSRNASLLVYSASVIFAPFFLFVLPIFFGIDGIWFAYPAT